MSDTVFTILTIIMFGTIELVCVVILILLFKIMGRYKRLEQDYLKVWDDYKQAQRELKELELSLEKSTRASYKKNGMAKAEPKIGDAA